METLTFVRAVRDIDALAKAGSFDAALARVEELAALPDLNDGQKDILAKKRSLLTSQSMRRAAVPGVSGVFSAAGSGVSAAMPAASGVGYPPLTLVPKSVPMPAAPVVVATVAPPVAEPPAAEVAQPAAAPVEATPPAPELSAPKPSPFRYRETLLVVGNEEQKPVTPADPTPPAAPTAAPAPMVEAPPVVSVPEPPAEPPAPVAPSAAEPPAALAQPEAPEPAAPDATAPGPADSPAAAHAAASDPAVDALYDLASQRIRIQHAPPMSDEEIEEKQSDHKLRLFGLTALLLLTGFAIVFGAFAIYKSFQPKDPPPVVLFGDTPSVGLLKIGMPIEDARTAMADAFGASPKDENSQTFSRQDGKFSVTNVQGRVSRIQINFHPSAENSALPDPDWEIDIDGKQKLRLSSPYAEFVSRLLGWEKLRDVKDGFVIERTVGKTRISMRFDSLDSGAPKPRETWRPTEIILSEAPSFAPPSGTPAPNKSAN